MKGYELALLVGIYVMALITMYKVKHIDATVETIAIQMVADKERQAESNR